MNTYKGLDLKTEWEAFIEFESHDAFSKLFAHYYKYLSYLGLKKGFKTICVKEGINDVFFYLWASRDHLSHIANHHNYIVTSFMNKLYRATSQPVKLYAEINEVDLNLSVPSVETQFIQRNVKEIIGQKLKQHVETLPDKQREMIFQKFYLGLSYKEIADANTVSINTVYNTIYKAVEKLKMQIGKEELAALSIGLAMLSILYYLFFVKIS